MSSEMETPPEALERSMRALNAGNGVDACAAALQGILQVLIAQHTWVWQQQQEEEEAKADGEAATPEGAPNPFGECAAGHEEFMGGCGACAADKATVVVDTVKMVDERRDRGD